MHVKYLAGALALAFATTTPAVAAAVDKPAFAKQQDDASAAIAAIEAISPDDEWQYTGYELAQALVEATSVDSVRAAAATGHVRAQWIWGHVLFFGVGGVDPDYEEAARMWLAGAEQGNARAQNDIGWMYHNGRGVPQDDAEAARWYRAAVEQHHAGAANDLGLLYEEGRGVAQDLAEARRLYELSVSGGNEYAAFNLGLMYERGNGVPVNLEEAMRYYERAAEWGHGPAQERLNYLRSLAGEGG